MKGLFYCFVMEMLLYVPMKESMHMLQQNRYQTKRYITWLKERMKTAYKQIISICMLFLPLLALCLIPNKSTLWQAYLLLMLVYGYVFWIWDKKHAYIIKIKATHRIRRLYVLFSIVYVGWNTVCYMYVDLYRLILFTPFLFLSPWIVLIFIQQIVHPLEQAIRNSYAKEAKAILDGHQRLRKIGITGSYGKTTVKNIIYTLLQDDYYTLMTPHSYNNQMGLTITIRTLLKPLHEVFVAEMGADHVGEIYDLMRFIHPSIGVVCAVGPQHLETFQSQMNILQEKMQMIECLPPDGIGVLNYDNAYIRAYPIHNTCKIYTYGIHQNDVDYQAVNLHYTPSGTSFIVLSKASSFLIHTCLLGEHNVLNIVAAICVAKAMHVSDVTIQRAIARLRPIEHRLEARSMDGYTILDDAYNANPEGAKYALDVLSQMPGQRILITPGFLDLGDEKELAHQTYAKQMCMCCDQIILVGITQTKDIYDTLIKEGYNKEAIHVAKHTQEAFRILTTIQQPGAIILLENDLPDAFNH